MVRAVFVGALEALDEALDRTLTSSSSVCVLATAAAFRGVDEALEEVRGRLIARGATVHAIPGTDRASASDDDIVARVVSSDVVVLLDGAPLHARSVWRNSPLAAALAASTLVCIGATGSVLGETMIDPRGGAPTTGLGLFTDVVVGVAVSVEQSARTRVLVGHQTLVELGRDTVVEYDGHWKVVDGRGLVVTRDGVSVEL